MHTAVEPEHGLTIRPAAPSDSRGIARIQVDSYRSAYEGLLPSAYLEHFTYEEQEEDWNAWLSSRSEQILLVAEYSSAGVIGYALSEPTLDRRSSHDAELLALHVGRASRGQGVGTQLVAATVRELERCQCVSLCLWVLERNPARLFYEKLGGKEVGRRPWVNNEYFGTRVVEVEYGWPDVGCLRRAIQTISGTLGCAGAGALGQVRPRLPSS